MKHAYLHEPLELEELAMQIFKVLLEEVPEPVIKHDLDQHAESLFLWHLRSTREASVPPQVSGEVRMTTLLLHSFLHRALAERDRITLFHFIHLKIYGIVCPPGSSVDMSLN